METRNEITAYLENISLVLLGIVFLAFPLVVTPLTTDIFTLPKQIVLGVAVLFLLLFLGARMISDGSVRLRRTPFDFPLLLLGISTFVSTLFAVNRADSLTVFLPFLLAIFSYFLVVNFAKNQSSLFFLLTSLVAGACLTSLISMLSFFQMYILPFDFAKVKTFSPLGSLLDQAMYFVLILPIALYLARPLVKWAISFFDNQTSIDNSNFSEELVKAIGFSFASLFIVLGLAVTAYQLLVVKQVGTTPSSTTNLVILPFEVGFQTGFAAISQDTGRVLQGFLFGSGYGTYATDFTRFKQAIPFNLNQNLWSLTFFRSSSFVLELLATTGILGIASFIFLIVKILKRIKHKQTRENPLFYGMLFAIITSFFLPFSPVMQALFFFMLAIFAVGEGLQAKAAEEFFDIELHFVAFKQVNPFIATPVLDNAAQNAVARIEDKSFTKALPVVFFILFLLIGAGIGFVSYRYVASDLLFQDSLVAATANDGLKTYNEETNAINMFPYRDAYYRIYSQTNLAIANNLAAQQPRNASPSAQTQTTIYNLIQQSINAARNATTVSPLTSSNWQNLSSIYRSLIGYGKGAEDFAAAAAQQGITLDPNNPQQYLNLGGIYYQLGLWDLAQRQFQIAVNLKPDFANAYYNLGHALESKNDLPNALVAYQTVQSLVTNDPPSLKKITDEITALQTKIGAGAKVKETAVAAPAVNQPPIDINTPNQQLPERKPQVPLAPAASSSAH